MALHISISAEPILEFGPLVFTNSFLTSLLVTLIIVAVSLWAKKNVVLTLNKKIHPFQNFLEMLVEGLHGLTMTITESRAKTKAIFPLVLSLFLFIVLNNWLGLLPGVGTIGIVENKAEVKHDIGIDKYPFIQKAQALSEEKVDIEEIKGKFVPIFRAGTADLNTTLALALVSVVSTQIIGVKFLGLGYFKKFINFKGPIDIFVGLLETISEFSKIISFAFRLFGNVFAGEVLLSVMAFLIPVIVPLPFIGLEIFVGAVQAFVFAMLSLVFMNMASLGHEAEHHNQKA